MSLKTWDLRLSHSLEKGVLGLLVLGRGLLGLVGLRLGLVGLLLIDIVGLLGGGNGLLGLVLLDRLVLLGRLVVLDGLVLGSGFDGLVLNLGLVGDLVAVGVVVLWNDGVEVAAVWIVRAGLGVDSGGNLALRRGQGAEGQHEGKGKIGDLEKK
jgi:hypothetical protein